MELIGKSARLRLLARRGCRREPAEGRQARSCTSRRTSSSSRAGQLTGSSWNRQSATDPAVAASGPNLT